MSRWTVPLSDLEVPDADVDAVVAALRSGWWTMGPRVSAFEEAFAAATGARHAIATANGTLALELMFRAAGIGEGDEVIVPAITFVATAAAVVRAGGQPVVVDIAGPGEPWMDPESARRAITDRTRAICFVSYAGAGGTLSAVARLAEEHGLLLLEDAAHAAGGRHEGRALGTIGAAGAFSLYSNKNLAVGEGGVVVAADDAIAERVRLLRSHGMTAGTWERHHAAAAVYDVAELGTNARMDELRAALASSRLERLAPDVEARRALSDRYRDALDGSPVATPVLPANPESACHLFPVLVDDRDARREQLARRGIQTAVHYPALHQLTALRGSASSLPAAEDYAARTLSLPLFPGLDEKRQDLVLAALTGT